MPTDNPQLARLTHEKFLKDFISDGVVEENVALMELKARNAIKTSCGGTNLTAVLRSSAHTIQGYGPAFEKNPTQPDINLNPVLNWGGLYGDYLIDFWDTTSNEGKPEALFSMQKHYLETLKSDFDEYMEDSIFLNRYTNDPREIGGFAAFIAATGTYAGISQTNSYWKAQITSGASGTVLGGDFRDQPSVYLTKAILNTSRGKGPRKTGRPQTGFMDRATYTYCHKDIESKRRYMTTNTKKLDMGHQNFVWDGVEFLWSDSATAAKVFLINWEYITLYVATSQLAVPNSYPVAYPPKGQLHQLISKLQLFCRSPKHQGKLSATGT